MQIISLGPDDLVWPATNATHEMPSYQVGLGSYKRAMYVDPHPTYGHNVALVEEYAQRCVEAYPLAEAAGAGLYLLSHEFTGRNNGLASYDPVYRRPDGTDWNVEILCHCGCGEKLKPNAQAYLIVLCGKRIPIMPSMTRYLVTHEYGHVTFYNKRHILGYTPGEGTKLERRYMALRGLPDYKEGPRWHQLISEIVANDFRTIVMGTETEFWPHEVPPLDRDSPIARWWLARTREEMEQIMGYSSAPAPAEPSPACTET